MSDVRAAPIVVHGWTIYAHPLFLAQVERLIAQVDALRSADPEGYTKKNATKRLAAIASLAFDMIPSDPTRFEYRQGGTLGDEYKHWFRAKFFQQYRLFFRFDTRSKTLILAWVNDEDTKRAYESDDDAYRTFRKMLDRGHPPDSWDALMREARATAPSLSQAVDKLR